MIGFLGISQLFVRLIANKNTLAIKLKHFRLLSFVTGKPMSRCLLAKSLLYNPSWQTSLIIHTAIPTLCQIPYLYNGRNAVLFSFRTHLNIKDYANDFQKKDIVVGRRGSHVLIPWTRLVSPPPTTWLFVICEDGPGPKDMYTGRKICVGGRQADRLADFHSHKPTSVPFDPVNAQRIHLN